MKLKVNMHTLKKNISVISRGVDIEYLDPSKTDYKKVSKFIKDYDVKNDHIKLVLPGRVTVWKGHKVAIEAMFHLNNKTNNNFELIFVGPTDNSKLKNNLLHQINELKLGDSIKFIGPSKEMNLIYSMADIVLSCATDPEAFGRIPVEAQSMGKMAIASNHGGHIETIDTELSGFLYPPLDSEKLADCIINAISSKIYLDENFKIKRRDFIRNNFTELKMCQSTLQIYLKVLNIK